MIKPTVGRVVLYTPSKEDCQGANGIGIPYGGQKCVAFITSVHGDRMINIAGFDPNGKPFAVWSCTLIQDDDQPAEYGRYCSWMPYQKGQAAKAEELEKKLAG